MSKTDLMTKRFVELTAQLDSVEATKKYVRSEYSGDDYIDNELLLSWKVKARNLLSTVCGIESEHYRQFVKCEEPSMFKTNYGEMKELKAVFLAAKEDYEGGYLSSIRNLVQAEVFDSELEQAKGLLSGGYISAAAVIAGVVLETTLRQLCIDRNIPVSKLDKMNSDLAKANVYHLLVQKRITSIADIRNNAAHGHPEAFQHSDVSEMIAYIERFISDHI